MSDGYSSDDEAVPRTSSVTLGFVDTEVTPSEQPIFEDSFIGGQPVWFHENSPPPEELVSCKNCGGVLALILQAFSPLEDALYDRALYVFGCQKSSCNRQKGTIRALRAVSKDPDRVSGYKKEIEESQKQTLDSKLNLGEGNDFLFDQNPFAGSDNPFGGANPFDQQKQTNSPEKKKQERKEGKLDFASIAAKAAPLPKAPSNKASELPEYPGYFLYVDQENFHKKKAQKLPDNVNIADSALDYELETSSARELAPESQAVATSLQDKVFQHFSEIVEYNPLQVLRYDLGGSPLLFSSLGEVAGQVAQSLVPKPAYNPSSERRFELQVMPKTIIDFEKNNVEITGGIEWGTIIVYTDVEDYVPNLDENHVGYVEEWVGVQWEEPVKRK